MPGVMNNFVVNVSHISHECDVIACRGEPTPDNVKGDSTANMTNMWWSLNCRATQIYTDLAALEGDKVPHGTR